MDNDIEMQKIFIKLFWNREKQPLKSNRPPSVQLDPVFLISS